MRDVTLYHGSRGGIDGKIQPISRLRCDFGKGFYMGEKPEQALGLIVNDPSPVLYTINFKLSEIPENRILTLKDLDWLYTILACRKISEEFNQTQFAKDLLLELNKYDVIIGLIADDSMSNAIRRFENLGLTDEGLIACLQAVKYGRQFVARTELACDKIEIISERPVFEKEAKALRSFSEAKRIENADIVRKMIIQYRNKGQYFDQLLDNLKEKEDKEYDD